MFLHNFSVIFYVVTNNKLPVAVSVSLLVKWCELGGYISMIFSLLIVFGVVCLVDLMTIKKHIMSPWPRLSHQTALCKSGTLIYCIILQTREYKNQSYSRYEICFLYSYFFLG